MRRTTRVAAALAGVALAVSLAGCSAEAGSGGDWRENEELPVPVGTVLDLTGPLNVYGIIKSQVTQAAIENLNANGGVLGRQLELIEYDSASANDQNVQYANQLVSADDVAVVFGGVTSAAREAMRPVLNRQGALYVYSTDYEGGLCDASTLVAGKTASQLVRPLMQYASENVGKSVYIVGADYSFGRVNGEWVKHYAEELGYDVVGEDYIALDSSNFGATIGKIQSSKPDVVVSFLVGANHLPFYREFSAKSLGDTSQIVSITFGNGGENEMLSAEESQGIIAAGGYYEELDNPANTAFLERFSEKFGDDHDYVNDTAMLEWNGIHLWAEAVERAGTFEPEAVAEAYRNNDISIETPTGTVTADGATHHAIQDVSIVQMDQGEYQVLETYPGQKPLFEQENCNLIEQPDMNKLFTL